jgi:DNA-binding MarR family transcriptional regulator
MARRRPSADTMLAWRALLRAFTTVTSALDRELRATHDLPLEWYDVLLQLVEHGGRLQMHDLADQLLISPSNCTRLIDRMERNDLVRREVDTDDKRVRWAILTNEGRRRQRRAAPSHLAGIERHVGSVLAPGEAAVMAAALARLTPSQVPRSQAPSGRGAD